MKTKEAAIGRWPEIFEYYKLPGVTGKRHFKWSCPVCKSRGSFRCDDKDQRGTWICKCGAGDGWLLLTLTQGKDIKDLMDEVDSIIGNEFVPDRQSLPKKQSSMAITRQKVTAQFSRLAELRGTGAEGYLHKRGIFGLPPENVRFCASQKDSSGGTYQAIWSLATDDKANLCYLHRILLDGDKKAGVVAAKKLMKLQEDVYLEHASSVAIRMYPPATTLGIAEGVETALASREVYGCNVWAVMNSGFMAKFRAPPGVKHLIIFADMDPHSATGHSAAFTCAHGNLTAINDLEKVSVRWPDNGDFNDLLINTDRAREVIFTKRIAA